MTLSMYTGVLSQALTVGALLGAIAGVIFFTVSEAGERVRRIIVGVLIGGFAMAIFQAFRISALLGDRLSTLDPVFRDTVYSEGALFWEATVRTLQMAFLGGLLMVVTVSPARSIIGAIGGTAMGLIAAVVAWAALDWLNAPTIPLIIFGGIVLALWFFLYDLQPLGHED